MRDPLTISCPRCRAPAGKACRTLTGASVNYCKARLMVRRNPDCDCGEEGSCEACGSCEECCQCEAVCECGAAVDCECGRCITCCECPDLMPSDVFRHNPMEEETSECWDCGETFYLSGLTCSRTGDSINECRCSGLGQECSAYCDGCF